MMNGSIHPEYIAVINIYVPDYRGSKHLKVKLIELKRGKSNPWTLLYNFTVFLLVIDRIKLDRKINKNIGYFKTNIKQKTSWYTFFSSGMEYSPRFILL